MADVDWNRLEGIFGGLEGPTWEHRQDAGPDRQTGQPRYALGRFGVMDFNLPSWSREALGREVSTDEFIRSPEVQRQIFRHRMGLYLRQTGGNEEHAAAMWFAGPRGFGNRSPDNLGTDVDEYTRRFRLAASRYDGTRGIMPPTTTTAGAPPPTTTPPRTDTPPATQPPPTGQAPPPDVRGIVAELLAERERAQQPNPATAIANAAAADIEPLRLPGLAPRRPVSMQQIRAGLNRRIGV